MMHPPAANDSGTDARRDADEGRGEKLSGWHGTVQTTRLAGPTHVSYDGQITFRRVADLECSHAFYAEGLGLTLVLDQGRCRIYRVNGEAFVGICSADAGVVAADSALLCLLSADVDACFERLLRLGVEVEQAPCHNDEFAIYHAFVRDPDGHLVELQTFDDPQWAGDA